MNASLSRLGAAAAAAGLLHGAAIAVAQDAQTLDELNHWHERLVRPNEVISVEDGRQARARLKGWKLPLDKLTPQQRGWTIALEIYAALAVGDAARAAEYLPDLQREFPDTRETLHAAWLVAGASGDGELAKRTLEKLSGQQAASEKALALRLARLRMVGQPAPDVTVGTEDGRPVALRQRAGVVLVLDFWRQREKPADRQVKALRAVYETYAAEPTAQFLGVNSDGPADVEAAMKFALEHGYKWPQHYERRAGDAPLADQAFRVEAAPWTVVIDAEGNVRWVGAGGDPEFQYALRAAAAEATGEYRVVRPMTSEGVQAPRGVARKPTVEPESKREKEEQPAASGELPHNPEAARLLDQARVFLKTGRKNDAKKILQEIIEKYPGTWEARDAKERLDAL